MRFNMTTTVPEAAGPARPPGLHRSVDPRVAATRTPWQPAAARGVRIWAMGARGDNFGSVPNLILCCAACAPMVMPRCCQIQPA